MWTAICRQWELQEASQGHYAEARGEVMLQERRHLICNRNMLKWNKEQADNSLEWSWCTNETPQPSRKKRAQLDPTVEKEELKLKISEELTPWFVDVLVTRQQATILSSKKNVYSILEVMRVLRNLEETRIIKSMLFWDYVNRNSAGLYNSRWGESCFITDLYSWIPQLPDKKFYNFLQCRWLGSDSSWAPSESWVRGVLSPTLVWISVNTVCSESSCTKCDLLWRQNWCLSSICIK